MANLVGAPAGSPLTAKQLAAAEALIAAHLGVTTLERREGVSESGTVGPSGLIALVGPAVSVQAVTLSGAPAAGVLRNPWTLDVSGLIRPGYGGMWGGGYMPVPYTVTYTSGWTADTLPDGIRQAVLLTATALAAGEGREGITSERVGPVSRTYADVAGTGTLPADARALLRPWLPLRV